VYLIDTPARGDRGARARVLYWFRTPPGIKVGRDPFDEETRRTIERQNPDLLFDWQTIIATPPPPEPEPWRERRRLERLAKQARRAERGGADAGPAAHPGPAPSTLSAGRAETGPEDGIEDIVSAGEIEEGGPGMGVASGGTSEASGPGSTVPPGPSGRRRRRNRRRRGGARKGVVGLPGRETDQPAGAAPSADTGATVTHAADAAGTRASPASPSEGSAGTSYEEE
jgi:hypothetical protein